MYLEVAGLEGVGRICFAEDMNQWEVLAFTVMNICCLDNGCYLPKRDSAPLS